jgi:peptidoglycan hydrolase-like protein with peptidoglycan-binding domain
MATVTQTLRWGSKGSQVETLQIILNIRVPSRQLPDGKLVVDGIFGSKTYRAVKLFQSLNKHLDKPLKADGIVGENTRTVLNKTKVILPIKTSPKTTAHQQNISAKEITSFRDKIEREMKERIIPDASKRITIYYNCVTLRNQAKAEIEKIRAFNQYTTIALAVSETAIVTALTAGAGELFIAGRAAQAARLSLEANVVIGASEKIAWNMLAGVLVPTGASIAKAVYSKGFSADDAIGLVQTIQINKLSVFLSSKIANRVSVLGLVYTAAMTYLDTSIKNINHKNDLAFKKRVTLQQVRKSLALTMRWFGNDKYLYEQLQFYYHYRQEAIARKVQMEIARRLVDKYRLIKRNDNLIKQLILASRKNSSLTNSMKHISQ